MKRKITAKKKKHKRPTDSYWKHLFGKSKPKRKAKPKPKAVKRKRVKAMSKKKAEKEKEEEQTEFAEAPAPPKVKSEPTEPPGPLDVRDAEVPISADPEDPNATFELDLLHHDSIRGTGPKPEPEAEPKEEKQKKEEKAKQLKADEAAEQEFLNKEAKK